MKRYALGFFRGSPAMFEQADGDYVKWADVPGLEAAKSAASVSRRQQPQWRGLAKDPSQ